MILNLRNQCLYTNLVRRLAHGSPEHSSSAIACHPAITSKILRTAFSQLRTISSKSNRKMPVSSFNWNNHQLVVTQSPQLKEKVALEKLVFGRTFTDYMLVCEWKKDEGGWLQPEIKPFSNFSIHPAASGLHYGVQCFEGMKAYKDSAGKIRLFRPEENMERLLQSAKRLALPEFDKMALLEMIKRWVRMEESWIPDKPGYSLYIRPTFISIQETLGVGPSNHALLYVIGCPVGQYYAGLSSVAIYAEDKYVRAWPCGTGCYKIGGNYAPGILPQLEVSKDGYSQILWLLGDDHQLTEVGTMNLFIFMRSKQGQLQLFTPKLDGTILPGVVRKSILEMTREWNEFEVVEGSMNMSELQEALQEGRILEMFGSGTAVVISPIHKIHWKGKDLMIPLDPTDPSKSSGPLAQRLWQSLIDIQYGKVAHAWSMAI